MGGYEGVALLPEGSPPLGPIVGDERGAAAAAAGVPFRVGLGQTRPRVLAVGWSFIVALEPLSVVARVSRIADDKQRVPQSDAGRIGRVRREARRAGGAAVARP